MRKLVLDHPFSHFIDHGYEVLGLVPDGLQMESYKLRPWFQGIYDKLCEMAEASLAFTVVTQIRDGNCYWLAVDPERKGDIEMVTTLPTFKDLVADEVAKYLEIQQERLQGDENLGFVLGRIVSNLRNGDWKRYENVQPKGRV